MFFMRILTFLKRNLFSSLPITKMSSTPTEHNTHFLQGLALFVGTAGLSYVFNQKTGLLPRKSLFSSSHPKGKYVDYWLAKDSENDYLKEVFGDKAIDWVKEQNAESLEVLGNPENTELYNKIKSILDSKEKIPYISKNGKFYYNYWQDEKNPRGILRRTTLESYFGSETSWETVLDVDELGKLENESWVYHGYIENKSLQGNKDRILIKLSKGGSDADVVREFDLNRKTFIPESENGFILPEAKSRVSWKSDNELIIGTDFQEAHENSLTDSGYPRLVKLWKRGTNYKSDSILIYEGEKADVSISGYLSRHQSHVLLWLNRAMTFYTSEKLFAYFPPNTTVPELNNNLKFTRLNVPNDAEVSSFLNQFLIWLRSDWELNGITYLKGSLLAIPIEEFLHGNELPSKVNLLFSPTSETSLDSYTCTKDYLLLTVLEDVKTKIVFWKFSETTSKWSLEDSEKGNRIEFICHCSFLTCKSPTESQIRGVSISAVDRDDSNSIWLTKYSWIQVPLNFFL